MLIEQGKVVRVESDALWVETILKSTCGSCSAESGCGQGLMAKFFLGSRFLKVLLEGRDASLYREGDVVSIGIPEAVIVKVSMLSYLLPLGFLVLGAVLGQKLSGETASILMALMGLVIGAGSVRFIAKHYLSGRRYHPVLMDEIQPLTLEK